MSVTDLLTREDHTARATSHRRPVDRTRLARVTEFFVSVTERILAWEPKAYRAEFGRIPA